MPGVSRAIAIRKGVRYHVHAKKSNVTVDVILPKSVKVGNEGGGFIDALGTRHGSFLKLAHHVASTATRLMALQISTVD